MTLIFFRTVKRFAGDKKSDFSGTSLVKKVCVSCRARAQLSDNSASVLRSRGWRYVDNPEIYQCAVEAAFPLRG